MITEMSTIKSTLGMALSVIGTEHMFSAGLSSPWSVAKFSQTLEDQQEVWYYFNESAKSSLLFGGILSLSMKSLYPIIGTVATVLYYRNLYGSALKKASLNVIKTKIEKQGIDKTIEEITSKGSLEEIQNLFKYLNIQ